MLTTDQRWLLWAVGLSITRALIDDAGLDHYMASMHGGTRHLDDGPDWLTSFETRANRIIGGPLLGDVRVTVTRAEIRRFRATIPADLLAELKAIDKARLDEHWRTELWCHCRSREPHQDFLQRDRYHPTDAEDAEHLAIAMDLIDQERECLRRILGVDAEPVGQLELFEVANA